MACVIHTVYHALTYLTLNSSPFKFILLISTFPIAAQDYYHVGCGGTMLFLLLLDHLRTLAGCGCSRLLSWC